MSKTLTPSEIRDIEVDVFERLNIRRDVQTKHFAPYSKREEGRDRRNQRRQAIARKRSFLA
jgi:hypothetical protein